MKDCVEHFSDGRKGQRLTILSFWTKFRSEIIGGLLSILLAGTPFWWSEKLISVVYISVPLLIVVLAVLVCATISGISWFLRHCYERDMRIKAACHMLAHNLRDEQNKLFKRFEIENSQLSKIENERSREYFERICGYVSQFFTVLLPNKGIEAGIRLAIESKEGDGVIVFATVGRSTGLNSKRDESSEAIPANEGIPGFFYKRKNHGVLIYNDLAEAHKQGTYKKTANDDVFKGEIVTMMVAPLNAWDGKRFSMFGLLYVTSRYEHVFSLRHVDSMRFVADVIAMSVAFRVDILKRKVQKRVANRRVS
ncbi:MAG: hypothetical protein HGA49_13205 [Eubacteriaceae bacterium]|nr:hypothetical protein [Eubacteriaceae bacterium]